MLWLTSALYELRHDEYILSSLAESVTLHVDEAPQFGPQLIQEFGTNRLKSTGIQQGVETRTNQPSGFRDIPAPTGGGISALSCCVGHGTPGRGGLR